MKKVIYIVLAVAAAVACLAGSIRIERFSERNARLAEQAFDPEELVDRFWHHDLDSLLAVALDWRTFDSLLQADPKTLADRYGKNIGIGFPKSIFLTGSGVIGEVNKDFFTLQSPGRTYAVSCGRIFSNTVREASGVFDIDAFENTMDFNLVSSQINGRIDSLVIDPVRPRLKNGAVVIFAGAADVYPDRPAAEILRIVPLKLEVVVDAPLKISYIEPVGD
ncbi:MAG: DUF2291 family protein [Rikenellaceae bacterium]|jgi:predicted lipoprotein|nr:DUF2291 family protein [Rikenellaceae bacterium]